MAQSSLKSLRGMIQGSSMISTIRPLPISRPFGEHIARRPDSEQQAFAVSVGAVKQVNCQDCSILRRA